MWILCEHAYAESIWCKQLCEGLVKEFKKRRISCSKVYELQEVNADDAVYMIGITNQWLSKAIEWCNQRNCVPVVLSTLPRKTVSESNGI